MAAAVRKYQKAALWTRLSFFYQKSKQQSSKRPCTSETLEALDSPSLTSAGPGHGGGCQLSFWGSHVHKAISRPAWAVGKTQCYPPGGEGPGREREVVAIQQEQESPGELPLAQPEAGEEAPAGEAPACLCLLAEVRQSGLLHHLQHPSTQKLPVLRADL